jgi:hypothetical protein
MAIDWQPMTETGPPAEDRYLVYVPEKTTSRGRLPAFVGIGEWTQGRGFAVTDHQLWGRHITHWAILEPPKENTK